MEKGLFNGLVLGAGLVAGGLAVVYLFKQAGIYPLRLAASYQNNWGSNDFVRTPSTGDINIGGGRGEYLTNTLPPHDPMLFSDSDDWMVRKVKSTRWSA